MKVNLSPKQILIISFFVLIGVYALFQARFIILGPQVKINYPRDGETLSDQILEVNGRAKNVAWISLDGRQIYTDEKGYFKEKLILSEGVSIMTVEAKDRFGRETIKTIQVFYKNS